MEEEISSVVTAIKEKSRNVCINHMKHYACNLKNVYVDELELSELISEIEPDTEVGSNDGKQRVRVPFSSIFDQKYSVTNVKPNAVRKTILLQGEAAMGKTMLCLSVVEEWANGRQFQDFQLVILLPLSSRNVASASSLSGLLNVLYADFKPGSSSKVASYLKNNGQHNILLIADGWEELQDSQCQTGSFLHSLLFSSDIIPTSSITVLITSRPGYIETSVMQTAIDRLITLTGFDRKSIEPIVQSEFAGDLKRVHYLKAQLNDNPLVANTCITPLNLAVVCQASDAEPLPDTMTKLYSKLVWMVVSASIDGNYPHEGSLSSHHDLPEELQQLWWQVCELAFNNVEKGCNTFSSTALTSSKISHFGLTKPIAETGDTPSSPFIHPCFEEYLAALHLSKQPKEAQVKFMCEFVAGKGKTSMAITFWHFFVSNYAHQVGNLNPDVVDQVLKILLAAYCTTKQNYYMDLCHLSYEAKHNVVNQKVVEAISITGVLRFSPSRDVYDFNSMVHVLQNIAQNSEVEINFQDSNLKPEHVNHLANTLCEKSSIVRSRGLNLSGNRLSNSLAVDFFSKASAALKSLKVLILRNCDIGTTSDIKAILSALTQSTSPTVTHFDLSFNHISISFLQVLQQHLESYDTFDYLQSLGLKGSLNNDVTIGFLAIFSDALSLKCKHLRRLDLSENNLGEPGNPDLCKIISQLLSLGRDFNLCLNDEYMSEVHDEFVCVMEESIKKKGTINHTIAHGVIVGPGRSGKNTLMSRLMGNGPPKSDTFSPSTGVLESIVKVEVKKLCTVATAVNNLEWKKLQYDEEALELIMTTARHHSAMTTISKPIVTKYIIKEQTESPTITSTESPVPSIPLGSPKCKTKYRIVKLFKKFKRSKARKSDQNSVSKVHGKERSAIVYSPDVEPVDIFKQAIKLRGMDALREHLESSWSLYLTNTGGQIEFQEHLPLLVCGPSIFFVTFPLHHDLDKPYDVRYQYPDGRVETYKSPGTLLQELLQTLATISASHFTSELQRHSETRIKPKIFFVGTHKDCLPPNSTEEIIQRKDELLQSCVRQTTLFDQGSIQFAEHPKQLIFTVNNLSDDDDEFQKIRSAVQITVEKDELFTIECPSSWLILSLILRAKHKSDQVLTFNRCLSIARECGITDRNELNQALSFIHSKLGLVRYFNVKDLNTLVVIDPQVLFDKITDLIVKTFTIENVDAKEIEDFHHRGIIPVAVMQKLSDKHSSNSQLPFIWLTDLLNYLRIAAFFTDKDGDKYFFPSALCHAPESHSTLHPNKYYLWPSLLVGFKSGFCPRGLPGALIKYLMTNEMRSKRCWNIIPNKIFKNKVSFAIQAHGNIMLTILPTHLEISYYSETDLIEDLVVSEEDSKEDQLVKENELMNKTCEMTYMQIKKAMSTITSQCMKCNYFFGFYCTLPTCQSHKHPAEIEYDGKNPFKVVCKVVNKRGNLPRGYEIWNLQKKRKTGIVLSDNIG